MLKQAAAWIYDQTGEAGSDTLLDDSGEYDSYKVHAAIELSKRLLRDAAKIEVYVRDADQDDDEVSGKIWHVDEVETATDGIAVVLSS